MVPRSISTMKERPDAVPEHQAEHKIGDEAGLAQCASIRKFDFEGKRIARLLRRLGCGCDDVVRMEETHVAAIVCGPLQRNMEIDDLKLVLDERSAGFTVPAAPFDVGEFDAVMFGQEPCPAIGECVGDRG